MILQNNTNFLAKVIQRGVASYPCVLYLYVVIQIIKRIILLRLDWLSTYQLLSVTSSKHTYIDCQFAKVLGIASWLIEYLALYYSKDRQYFRTLHTSLYEVFWINSYLLAFWFNDIRLSRNVWALITHCY